MKVPFITTAQMVEVDRLMIEEYGIELLQMMENAGRNLARLARRRFLGNELSRHDVVVLAGTGGNGGGAMVCARWLHNWGANVRVFSSRPRERMTPVPRHQFEILQRMGIPVHDDTPPEAASNAALIVDGLIGYSLKGAPRERSEELIRWANEQAVPTLSLDVPSGVDATTGQAHDPSIVAEATMTLALPKRGLEATTVRTCVGELYLADISVPPGLYAEPSLGIEVGPIFADDEIVSVELDP